MSATGIKVQGLEGLKAQIREVGAVASARAMRRAARKAMQPVLEDAQRRVPVRTGLTREMLKLGTAKGGDGDAVVAAGIFVRLRKLPDGSAGPAVTWWFVEKGTAHSEAQPFLRPAFDSRAEEMTSLLAAEVNAGMERAVKRARGTR